MKISNRGKKNRDILREIKGKELKKEERDLRTSVEAHGAAMVVA